jgi:hypothetical protein
VFQHLTLLFSFIFAIAFTHVLASATKLIRARRRVRFSGLLAAWMFIAANLALIYWISIFMLEGVKSWSVSEVFLQLIWIVPIYFTCSLVSMEVPKAGEVDMHAFYEEERPAIFSAFIVLEAMIMVANYLDRYNIGGGWIPSDWIVMDLSTVPYLIAFAVAGWAKSRKLQWLATFAFLVILVLNYVFSASLSFQSAPTK